MARRAPQAMAIEPAVREFVVQSFLFGREVPLASDESLLDRGLIDSTGVMELIAFLESRFGISVDDEEIVPDNLDSIERVCRFVESKLRARA
jgi:acyl carrier protein